MSGIFGVSKSSYSPPKKMFTDPADWGGNGPNIFDSLAENINNAQKSDPKAWTKISVPQKDSPGATKTVPYGSQRAFKRTVTEPDASAPASIKAKPFDAGSISQNSGRIVILGQMAANDLQDTYKISLNTPGKLKLYAPNPDYDSTKPGSKLTLGASQVDVYDPAGKLIASSDVRNAAAFSNWITLSTEITSGSEKDKAAFAGLQLARGDYTVKITRENPPAVLNLGVNAAGELDFTGTVLDDKSKVNSSLTPSAGAVTITNSEGVKYAAAYQLVKKTEGGVAPPLDPKDPKATPPAAGTGFAGGPDIWELQLVSLTPLKKGDPTAEPPITGTAPVIVGQFELGGLDDKGKVLPPKFTASGTKISFANVEVTPGVGDAPATRKVTPVTGELSVALKDPDASTKTLTPPGVILLNPGDIKTSLDGAHNVANKTPVNYSLFAVMGDPGATTFYTVKTKPQTAEEKKKAEQEAAVAAAKQAAKSSGKGAILSLFT